LAPVTSAVFPEISIGLVLSIGLVFVGLVFVGLVLVWLVSIRHALA
jgi:hypothetical protein